MYFDADGGRDATSGFVGLGVGHMFGERGSCVVAAGFFAGHRVGFDFHRAAGDENPDFARFPCVRIPRLGRRQRNVDQDRSFQQRRGMDDRFFSGRALAAVSGDRVDAVAHRGADMDRPAALADLARLPLPGGSHRYRLHHRDQRRQRIPADGKPDLQRGAPGHGRVLGVALQSDGRGGSLLVLRFRSPFVSRHHRQHDDPWAIAVGGQQWRQPRLGGNRGDARRDGDHQPRALRRQHGRGRRLQPDDRGAAGRDDVRRIFQYLDLGARGGLGLVWIRAGLSNVG